MTIVFISKVSMDYLNDTIVRDEDQVWAKTYHCSNLFQGQYTCLQNSYDLTFFKVFIFLSSDLNLILKSQLGILIERIDLESIGAKVLNLLLENFLDTESIWLLLLTHRQGLLVFFVSLFIWLMVVVVVLLENEILWGLLFGGHYAFAVYDAITGAGYLLIAL